MSVTSTIRDNLNLIIAAAAVFGLVVSGVSYFAKASDLEATRLELAQTQQRLNSKIANDKLFYLQQRAWMLEERNKENGRDCLNWKDVRDREEYRTIMRDMEELKAEEKKVSTPK